MCAEKIFCIDLLYTNELKILIDNKKLRCTYMRRDIVDLPSKRREIFQNIKGRESYFFTNFHTSFQIALMMRVLTGDLGLPYKHLCCFFAKDFWLLIIENDFIRACGYCSKKI